MTKQASGKVLIADDEPAITSGLSAILADEGYAIDVVADGQRAVERLSEERFGVVLADLKMPNLDGLALMRELQQREILTECIIITGQGTIDSAVEAMKKGAYDYIEKPLNADKLNRLKALIPKALEKFAMQEKNRELTSRLEGLTHYAELIGESESMREVYHIIDAVASSMANVLILGESGTGKELVARAVHSKSDRASKEFYALNCAALPKEILESLLFGHMKGAFTGATNDQPGAFEMASGGTIFLDEVAEMAPDIQVKLLRALEDRRVRRLGGKKEIPVDIRIVSATNKNLQKAITDGELREDLYYRLAVVQIDLPPLRERSQDIRLLATEFLANFSTQNSKSIDDFEPEAWDWILSYNWPGNVRELKNAVERAVIMTRANKISLRDIMPRHLRSSATMTTVSLPVGASMADARKQLVLTTLAANGWDFPRTAKVLGLGLADVLQEVQLLLSSAANGGGDGLQLTAGGGSNGGSPALRKDPADEAVPAPAKPKRPTPKSGTKR